MVLVLDVGNTQIYGAVFDGEEMKAHFRKTSRNEFSSDEMGVFFRAVLREKGIDYKDIKDIAISSVVPSLNHTLKNAGLNYFGLTPFFLSAGTKTKLKIKYKNPGEVGADRIANAIAATHLYPNKNLIIIDMGTATTFCAVSANREYLGGTIIPGLRISMESLGKNTAKLPTVEILKSERVIGRSTVEGIQAGLFYGHLSMLKGITTMIKDELFNEDLKSKEVLTIGTGGFWRLFENENVFDIINPDLVLKGTLLALTYNKMENNND